nr:putative reverse transcriptase domain-containing protein [Tanacetum cinerariifolium]
MNSFDDEFLELDLALREEILSCSKMGQLVADLSRQLQDKRKGCSGGEQSVEGDAEDCSRESGAPPIRECSFTGYLKCNTTVFHRNEGAVELSRWFEKTESIFSISECAKRNKVKFAAAILQGRALTWWNSQVSTLGLEVANGKSWTELKTLIKEEFCPAE